MTIDVFVFDLKHIFQIRQVVASIFVYVAKNIEVIMAFLLLLFMIFIF